MSEYLYPRPLELPSDARHVVVEASAGTGKTFFLEHRVLDLIVRDGARLEQIAVVTFTEKAAHELRRRIRAAVERVLRSRQTQCEGPAWRLGPDERTRLQNALRDYDAATITTIHGFCHRLLDEDPLRAGRFLTEAQIATEDAFADAYRQCQLREMTCDPEVAPYLRAWLTNNTEAQLRDALWKAFLQGAGKHPVRPIPPGPTDLARDILAWRPQQDRLVAAATAGSTKKAIDRRLRAVFDGLQGVTDVQAVILALREQADDWKYLTGEAPTRDWRVDASLAPFSCVAQQARSASRLIMYLIHHLSPRIWARMQTDKQLHGTFDFDDMLTRADEALRGARGQELAQRLRTRWPWALVDEAQDTDEAQWRILRSIWPDQGLTVVGDSKQSIYSFRGADVMAYRTARSRLVDEGAAVVRLGQNYRATDALTEAQNVMTRPGLDRRFFSTDESAEVKGGHGFMLPGAPVVWWRWRDGTSKKAAVEAAHFALIADEMLANLGTPYEAQGQTRTLSYRDMMVLGQTNDDIARAARALRQRGIPCVYVLAEKLFATQEASDIADVLSAIVDPRNPDARARALLTDFFSVPDAALTAVITAPPDHPAALQLWRWHELAERRDLHRLFAHLVRDSGIATRLLLLEGGERVLTNIQHILELLIREAAQGLDLSECVQRLRQWIAGEDVRADDFDVQRAEAPGDAVQLMTVHRAKGAEAPFVFLVGGDVTPRGAAVRSVRAHEGRVVADMNDTTWAARAEAERLQEVERLAYVAITRPKLRLYVADEPPTTSDAPTLRRIVLRAVAHAERASAAHVRAIHVETALREPVPPSEPQLRIAERALSTKRPPLAPAPQRLGPLQLSYSMLAKPHAPRPVSLGENDLPAGAQTGRALHALLEQVDLGRLRVPFGEWQADPNIRQLGRTLLDDHELDAKHLDALLSLGYHVLTAPVPSLPLALPALLTADKLAREVPFLYPDPSEPTRLLTGAIDVLAVFGTSAWIIDYKTDAIEAHQAHALAREHYGLQAAIYAAAAARCLPADCALAGVLVWYVRPNVAVSVLTSDELARAIRAPLWGHL